MAIKDLNNKRTGDKLYASEWNDVMNEILAHFKNKRIHEDIVVTTGDENLLIYKDTNDVEHQFVLYPKERTTYGELFILSVNGSQLDEYDTYNINNVSAEENTIDFGISYSRAVNIDGKTDHYEKTGATITALELPQGFSVIGTPTDSIINIKVPENKDYTTKNYQFSIKVSMDPEHENAQNTKTFAVNLTQNAKDDTYGNPYISEVRVNGGEIPPDEIPSAETKIKIELIVMQEHNGQPETVIEFDELQYEDYEKNWHDLETPEIQEITVPINTQTTEQDRSLNVVIRAHGKSLEDGKISLTQVADEIDYYGDVNITGFSYSNLNYGANSSTSPSSSLHCEQEIVWKSKNITYTTNGLTKLYSKSTISDPNVTVNQTNGTVTKTTANESDSEITLGNVLLTVTGQNDKSNTDTATVKQNGTPMPDLIYGQIPIKDETALGTFTSNPSSNINDTLINSNFAKVPTFSDGNLTIEATDVNNDYVALCFLIKDTSKNFYKVTTIPGLGDLHDEFNECGFNSEVNYKGTYTYNNVTSYKLYISFFEKIESAETNRYYISNNKKQ